MPLNHPLVISPFEDLLINRSKCQEGYNADKPRCPTMIIDGWGVHLGEREGISAFVACLSLCRAVLLV